MPVRNGSAYLSLALQSVFAQTISDWELIVVDDGSDDNTLGCARELLEGRPSQVIADGKRLGVWARLNQALDVASGKYVARMDADDVMYPERLERQLAYLEQAPGTDLVGAQMLIIGLDGEVLGERRGPLAHEALCRRPAAGFRLFHPTYFGRSAWFKRWGYRCNLSEDQDMLLRSYRTSRFANLDEILLAYRVRPQLDLSRAVRGRVDYVRAVHSTSGWASGEVVLSAALHATVAAAETATVLLGLERHLLRNRVMPTGAAERRRWQQILGSLQAPSRSEELARSEELPPGEPLTPGEELARRTGPPAQ